MTNSTGTLQVKVRSVSSTTSGTYWEGTVSFTGTDINLATAKLSKADGCTRYSTKSSVVQAIHTLERKLGLTAEITYQGTSSNSTTTSSKSSKSKSKTTSKSRTNMKSKTVTASPNSNSWYNN